ncbi:MAG TPA: nucleoside deaminase [Actinoplanes sp.]|nr:nucleoside deaminase [Actinoplanes sp.]
MDTTMLRRAVELAAENAAAGQLPFGALVVRDGQVLATGVNTALRDHDPAAHAEVAAVRNACRSLGVLHLSGAVVYTSCEPCPMCLSVAATAGIDRMYFAALGSDIPDLHYPAPPPPVTLHIEHVPVDGSAEPFQRYLDQL